MQNLSTGTIAELVQGKVLAGPFYFQVLSKYRRDPETLLLDPNKKCSRRVLLPPS